MEDDVYNGYHIPAGTTVLVNIWGILHDEHRFPDPLAFNPDRFLPGSKLPQAIDPRAVIFGYGRRICSGKDVSHTALFIFMSMMLSTFDICDNVNPNGSEEPIGTVELEFTGSLVSAPKPFSCQFKPRSKARVDQIQEAVAEDQRLYP